MPVESSEYRHISSLLGQRKVSGQAMILVLSSAMLFGLVGLALHPVWIAALIVLALGLGYVIANARQDRREVHDRNEEDMSRAL